MRSIWKGSISFGLVNIPVALYAATRREELKFRMLRAGDLSPINYKRVAELDGKDVPWENIVKGYEYEKGKFVVIKDDDFLRVDIEATDTIDIIDFVELKEVNPIFFYKPYYLEPQRGGSKAYVLLRDVLAQTGKAGISKVVIRTRQHLAAVKANGDALVLELMHFGEELVGDDELKIPAEEKSGARELEMAKTLVAQMTDKWDAKRYTDDYTSALMRLIDRKIESGGKELPTPKHTKKPTNVIDLVDVLKKSLDQASKGGKAKSEEVSGKTGPKKKARGKAA